MVFTKNTKWVYRILIHAGYVKFATNEIRPDVDEKAFPMTLISKVIFLSNDRIYNAYVTGQQKNSRKSYKLLQFPNMLWGVLPYETDKATEEQNQKYG